MRTQEEINEDRRTMAQAVVDQQRLETLDDAKRFARGWIETAAQHADNEAYYHDERDALLRLIVEICPLLREQSAESARPLMARVEARVVEAERLLEPEREPGPVPNEGER